MLNKIKHMHTPAYTPYTQIHGVIFTLNKANSKDRNLKIIPIPKYKLRKFIFIL